MTGSRSSIMRRSGLLYGALAFVMTLLFQNCDGGFTYDPQSGLLSSAGTSGVGGTQFRITTFNSAGLVVPEGQSFQGGIEYRIVASGQNVSSAAIQWQLLNNTGACMLRPGSAPETRFVQCTASGRVSIQSTAIWDDGSTTVLVSERTTSELIVDACGASSSNRVVFRIPNGTGASAWNSTTSPVVVYVGQTLRVCNDDATAHQMRTLGSPCASQPASMARGAFYDCSIANTMNVNGATAVYNGIYDQIAGVNAAFYVRPFDGQALYADTTKTSNGQSCASCHNAFTNSAKRGSSFTGIKNAIMNNTGNMGIYNGRITDDEIRAIAFSLNQ